MTDIETLKQQEHKLRISNAPKEEVDAVVKQIKQCDHFNHLLKDKDDGFEESEK